MRYLMPHGIGDHLFELGPVSGQSFVGTLINRDAVGEGEAFHDAPMGHGTAFVEAEKIRAGRFLLHYQDHVLQKASKAPGDEPQSACRDAVKFVGRDGQRSSVRRSRKGPAFWAGPRSKEGLLKKRY